MSSILTTAAELHTALVAGRYPDGGPVRVLDVRWWLDRPDGRPAFRAGHIPGARYADLDTQLGFTLSAVCAQLPAAQQAQLAAFCGTLAQVGGSLGALLSKAIETQGSGPINGARSFESMMGRTP